MNTLSAQDRQILETHYTRFFGPVGPILRSPGDGAVSVDIHQHPPTPDRPYWTLATVGMSSLEQNIPSEAGGCLAPRAELLLYARAPQPWMLIALQELAEMPFRRHTYIHWWHTVPHGQSLDEGLSLLTGFFFLPPYQEGNKFPTLQTSAGKVDFLWTVPITDAERKYALRHSSQALEDLIFRQNLDPVVDEQRPSLVPEGT